MIRRVFFITSTQIKVFEWDKKHLSSAYEFKNQEQSIHEFEHYLQAAQAISSHVLVELLDEDFQREKIPHIFGRDRQALIQRQITRHYRDNKYTHAHIIGRDKQGRRDDEVLLTSISNPEPVDIWMALFTKHDVPIKGIWSLPLMSETTIKKIGEKNENVLLVSRQMRSTLRESCFRHERLLLSRQVKIDQSLKKQHAPSAYLSDGIDQIHKYLSNQRIIPFGSKLHVYCLLPEDLLAQAQKDYKNTDIIIYHFVALESLAQSYGITSDHGYEADVFFSYLCSKKSSHDNYHPGGEKNAYYAHIAEKGLFYLSTLGSLLLLTIAALLVIHSLEIQTDIRIAESIHNGLKNTYARQYSHLEAQIESAQRMEETVHFSERLQKEAQVSPEQFLIPLGDILGKSRYSMIHISSLHWEKYHGNDLETLRLQVWKKTTPDLNEFSEYPYNEAEIDDKIPVITISGTMARNGLAYRETVAIMENFVRDLTHIEGVDRIWVARTPVDIRVNSLFSDQAGTDTDLFVESDDANIYEIKLLLKPSQPDENLEVADNA